MKIDRYISSEIIDIILDYKEDAANKYTTAAGNDNHEGKLYFTAEIIACERLIAQICEKISPYVDKKDRK